MKGIRVKSAYLSVIQMIERLHRQCLELVKSELEREGIRDLNNVQALILFNVGEETLTVGELTQRGYYLGSNVSYNVKKLVEHGYLPQERSPHDRRAIHVKASDKGLAICRRIGDLFDRHCDEMTEFGLDEGELLGASDTLSRLLRYWSAPRHLSASGRLQAVS